jgi:hypothetical protein
MLPRVRQVRHVAEYRLELEFTDGSRGEIDFRKRILGRGGVFAPLSDVEFFRRVQVDGEAGTIVWPNGVDFCPDVLYSLATGKPVPVAA